MMKNAVTAGATATMDTDRGHVGRNILAADVVLQAWQEVIRCKLLWEYRQDQTRDRRSMPCCLRRR
jgi:hypothetical protein